MSKGDSGKKLKVVKSGKKNENEASRNPLISSPVKTPLHPPKPAPEPPNVRHLNIVTGDDPDDAA